ncbi:hypothetical protein COUCH_04805 [Couchioplanes caeruleus]|uniref:hypothetical protein n=1 Tax=Couchioplanes caeruleus TaxID=56438 RepID=UPI0020BE40C3|nr:hypothetical protein [Couchioplanes caeruleus]UQU65649.1 hypothetical protein COUCH_04805 [Couchioplanes caeruleus]
MRKPGTSTAVDTFLKRRTRELRVHTTATGVDGAYDKTTYTYNRKNQLTDVVDVANNRWVTKYDVLGRVSLTIDPDKGQTRQFHNEVGDLTPTTRARSSS